MLTFAHLLALEDLKQRFCLSLKFTDSTRTQTEIIFNQHKLEWSVPNAPELLRRQRLSAGILGSGEKPDEEWLALHWLEEQTEKKVSAPALYQAPNQIIPFRLVYWLGRQRLESTKAPCALSLSDLRAAKAIRDGYLISEVPGLELKVTSPSQIERLVTYKECDCSEAVAGRNCLHLELARVYREKRSLFSSLSLVS